MLDQLVRRALFIRAQPATRPETQPETQSETRSAAPGGVTRAENAFTLSFLFTGVRCVLQYAILPFVLPVLGIAGAFAVPITLAITILAIASMVWSVRHLWRINYKRKWHYLAISVVALIILIAFVALDLAAL